MATMFILLAQDRRICVKPNEYEITVFDVFNNIYYCSDIKTCKTCKLRNDECNGPIVNLHMLNKKEQLGQFVTVFMGVSNHHKENTKYPSQYELRNTYIVQFTCM